MTAGLPGGNRNNNNGNFNNAGNNGNWWSSSPNGSNAWNRNLNNNNENVNRNNNNQRNGFSVRCVRDADTNRPGAVSLACGTGDLFAEPVRQTLLEGVFGAYYECRRNKRNKSESLAFECNLERELVELHESLLNFSYRPEPYRAFLVERPVLREVFAASFRDRVVHHWLMALLNPQIEDILSPRCFACREGLGVHAGHRAIQLDLAAHPKGWVLKLDIRGFFMNIDREALHHRLSNDLKCWDLKDMDLWVQHVLRALLVENPLVGCVKHPHSRWKELPPDKSLFCTGEGKGLPIGNLTSQILANYFLNPLDQWLSRDCAFLSYGRYVDDFYLVHNSKAALVEMIPRIRAFVCDELGLQLHPKKIHLQPVVKGVLFLGAFHHHDHAKLSRRLKGNMWECLDELNGRAESRRGKLSKADVDWALPKVNSYLGLAGQLSARRWERKWLQELHPSWWQVMRVSGQKMIRARHLQKPHVQIYGFA